MIAILTACSLNNQKNTELVFSKIKIFDSNWIRKTHFGIIYDCPKDWKENADSSLTHQLTVYKQSQYDSTSAEFILKLTKTIKAYSMNGQSFDDNFKNHTEILKNQLSVKEFKIDKIVLADFKGYRLSAMISLLNGMDSTFIYIINGNNSDYIIFRDGLTKYRAKGDSLLQSLNLN